MSPLDRLCGAVARRGYPHIEWRPHAGGWVVSVGEGRRHLSAWGVTGAKAVYELLNLLETP